MNTFLLSLYLGVELLSQGVNIYLIQQILTRSFPKWLQQFMYHQLFMCILIALQPHQARQFCYFSVFTLPVLIVAMATSIHIVYEMVSQSPLSRFIQMSLLLYRLMLILKKKTTITQLPLFSYLTSKISFYIFIHKKKHTHTHTVDFWSCFPGKHFKRLWQHQDFHAPVCDN